MKKPSSFVNTSAEDCKASLLHTTKEDLPVLREALETCGDLEGYKTKAQHIARRIRQLEKEVKA